MVEDVGANSRGGLLFPSVRLSVSTEKGGEEGPGTVGVIDPDSPALRGSRGEATGHMSLYLQARAS